MVEQRPVGFQWEIEVKERGATIVHVGCRYTRTCTRPPSTCGAAAEITLVEPFEERWAAENRDSDARPWQFCPRRARVLQR